MIHTLDPVNQMLEDFVGVVQETHGAFLLAQTSHALGSNVIDTLADDALVTATIGVDIDIEPIPVAELRRFKTAYPDFVIDVFHGKLVQHWQDLLNHIFTHYVDLHLSNVRPFSEFGRTQAKLNFADSAPLSDQLRKSVCRDFEFTK